MLNKEKKITMGKPGSRYKYLREVIFIAIVIGVIVFLGSCSAGTTTSTTPASTSAVAPTSAAAATSTQAELPDQITINSIPSGSQYAMAASVANVVEKYSGMKAFVDPTKSFTAAIPLFKENKLDFIFVGIGDVGNANIGSGDFKDADAVNLFRTVALGTGTQGTFFVRPNSGINSIKDLAGKKVMYLSASGGSFNTIAKLLLQYYGIENKVINIPSPSPKDRATALELGQVDAYYCSMRADAMQILSQSIGIKMLDIPQDAANYVHSKYPSATAAITPKGWNGGLVDRDVHTIGVATGIFCRTNLQDNVVEAVLKSIYDHLSDFQAGYPDLKLMTLNDAVDLQSTVPYHPGAVQFFKDRGVWTTAADTMQQQLLSQIPGATK